MSRCLYCYQPLPATAPDYHPAYSRKLFGKPTPLAFLYYEAQLLALAEQIMRSHITVTGVQFKLSLTLAATGDAAQPTRFTIAGALGDYIFKPPTPTCRRSKT
jgi:serine/threonine-protein kinase HipA